MNKSYYIQLAEYNVWANDKMHSWLNELSEEQWVQPITSSFNSIAETALHIAGVETIWYDRLALVKDPVWMPSVFKGSKKEVLEKWEQSSANLKSFIENFDETKLDNSISYKRSDGKVYELEYYQVFAHVINHSTYHRGQLITMLRQVGFTAINSIDLSTYFWSKKN